MMFHMLGPTIVARKMAKTKRRQGKPGIGDPHDHLVHPAAEIAREYAQGGADAAGDDGSGHADDQRHPCAEDQPAQHIARLKIGSEQGVRVAALHPERRLEDLGARDRLGRIVGSDVVGEHRDQDERHQYRQRQYGQSAGQPESSFAECSRTLGTDD